MKNIEIIICVPNFPLQTKYGNQIVMCTFETKAIRKFMEEDLGKRHHPLKSFRLPEGYYIEFMNTDRYSERPVVAKICQHKLEGPLKETKEMRLMVAAKLGLKYAEELREIYSQSNQTPDKIKIEICDAIGKIKAALK